MRQFAVSHKALSLGTAFFFVMGAIALNAWFSEAKGAGDLPVLGGPTSLIDPAASYETPSLAAGQASAESASSDLDGNDYLSTATLKGTISSNSSQGRGAAAASRGTVQLASDSKEEAEEKTAAPKAPVRAAAARYFIQPAAGVNWGELHSNNAVDIANKCGTPIVAAATGIVTERETGWNSGYGNYLLLEHPNGAKTRYAHMQSMHAKVGDTVNQGEEIGTIGNTGQVQGITGCHVHFEVIGARNPFIKR